MSRAASRVRGSREAASATSFPRVGALLSATLFVTATVSPALALAHRNKDTHTRAHRAGCATVSSGGGYSHRPGPRGGHFRRLSKAAPRSSKNGQSSCADGGSIGPSALSASAIVTGSISAQRLPASRHSPRARPAPAGSERCPMHAWTSVFAALPLPRHAAQATGGQAHSSEWLRSPDRGRSGPCFRHQRGSCGRFSQVFRACSTSFSPFQVLSHSISVSIISVLAIAIQKYIYIEMMEA